MRLWRRRRRTHAGNSPPLTPAQVAAFRAKGERAQTFTVVGFMGTSAAAIAAIGTLVELTGAPHMRNVVVWCAVVALSEVFAMVSFWRYRSLPALVFSWSASVATVLMLVAHLSSALSLESYLFGLAIAPFVLVRVERPQLRVAMAAVAIVVYFIAELRFSSERVDVPLSAQQVETYAQMNRVAAGLTLLAFAVMVEMRHTSMMRVLSGAARYGELRATTDELTGVYNRRPVIAQLGEWARKGRSNYAIALIDLDEFKRINDEFGHDCGDSIIRVVASTLRGHFRDSDMVSRWGGDEFLVLMPGIRHADLLPVLERLRRAIALIERRCGTHVHRVTVSIGASMGVQGGTPDECIAAADHALYRAKAEGRNRVVAVGVTEPTKALGRPDPEEELELRAAERLRAQGAGPGAHLD